MAQKFYKAPKKKVAARKDAAAKPQQIALVGTYKEKQLTWVKKNGVYNYPVKEGDEFDAEAFAKIKELWLYADSKGRRRCFSADFVGKMSREEFLALYPTYANLGRARTPTAPTGRARAPREPYKAYYVFKTTFLDYGPKLDDPDVLIRAMDFATGRGRTKSVKKAYDQYKADGEFAPLAAYLPTEISRVPRERLRVCEAAVQMDFLCQLNVKEERPMKHEVKKDTIVKPSPKALCKSIADYSKITVKAFSQRNLFASAVKETSADDIRVIELFAGVGGFRIGLERKAA